MAISPSHTSPATIEEEDEEEAPPPPIATRPEKTKSIYTKPIEEVEPKMTLTPINESTGKRERNCGSCNVFNNHDINAEKS